MDVTTFVSDFIFEENRVEEASLEELLNKLSDKARYDYDLVMRCINQNDQAAYTEIMDRYRDSIYYMLLKMVKNDIDAEDLTIEAFGKAFRRIGQYTPTYAFSTWLFKIATNNCIDYIRKKRAYTLSLDVHPKDEYTGEYAMQIESSVLDPEDEIIREQKIDLMRQVVSNLKPRYRRLIELRYFKEYSYEEISDELELPLGTVKAQLFRAKELLYNMLKGHREII
jgi:RNA polymerase sigma factor (sigma-70 family)